MVCVPAYICFQANRAWIAASTGDTGVLQQLQADAGGCWQVWTVVLELWL